jgi:ABC-type dipeptide/oligopeptide/nickel transport system ATPase subunit
MSRAFEAKDAVRAEVPLLVGLMGPSGGGKTYSALRLATGIQRVRGGDIYVIDTEARRSLHYADTFQFKHVEFTEPFGSLDYLEALRYCIKKGAGVVVVDSASHEHEGVGGYLATHESELQRMAGDDYAKRDRVKFAAWIKPAAQRRALINGLLQMNAAFIFCFRAKEKTKPVAGGKPLELGFMPIAGEEFLFEMTVNALLMPHANGVPTWKSDKVGENLMMKLPEQFRALFSSSSPMSEDHGVALAEWARGGGAKAAPPKAPAAAASVDDRVNGLRDAMKKAKSSDEVRKLWNHSRARDLRDALSADVREDLALVFESRVAELDA